MYSGEQEVDDVSIPHMVVFKVESAKDGGLDVLILHCKDFRREVFGFNSKLHSRVLKAIENRQFPKKFSACFARDYKCPESKVDGWLTFNLKKEFDRQKTDMTRWRYFSANKMFALCETYPREFLVPISVKDASLYHVAQFRTKGRVPALCWTNPSNKAALWRCAQLTPIVVQDMVGMAKIRCKEDEEVLLAMKAMNPTQPLHFVDCGGEDTSSGGTFWEFTPKQAQGMEYSNLQTPPIAALREEMAKFRDICINRFPPKLTGSQPLPFSSSSQPASGSQPPPFSQSSSSSSSSTFARSFSASSSATAAAAPQKVAQTLPAQAYWLETVAGTKHLTNVAALLSGASFIVSLMTRSDPASVVVQSPNGDDLCTVLVALSQIMMDPYYRSIKGFAVLFEKEWLAFGHKFIDLKKFRPGTGEVVSTIFMLFLDAVWQLIRQFPQSFEFSETLLLFTADALYSGQFGTFIFSTEKERVENHAMTKSISIWSFVPTKLDAFKNQYYTISKLEPVIHPNTAVRALGVWNGYYLRHVGRFIIRGASKLIQTNVVRQTTSLELQALSLPAFPLSMCCQLSHLHDLNLSQNYISSLPWELSHLSSLRSLHLGENQFTILPQEIFSFLSPSLKSLSLDANQLLLIPDSIHRLVDLEYIDFSRNCLSEATDFSVFSRLKHLDLSTNSLGHFPTDFSKQTQLLHLDLSHNGLLSISPSLELLTQLEFLSLSCNKFSELPALSRLLLLKHLDISGMELRTFPVEVFTLSALQSLNLSGMRQSGLPPPHLTHLPHLQELHLAGNQFITVPSCIMTFTSLTYLDLKQNLIIALPVEISNLVGLRHLDLSQNKLQDLTPGIGRLTKLRMLDISHNLTLSELPPALSLLRGCLEVFHHVNTPIFHRVNTPITTPSKYASDKLQDIMVFLHSLMTGRSKVYRMRLMIVGQENVGKTSLLRCLTSHARDKKKVDIQTVSTDGIDISGYTFLAPTNADGAIDAAGTTYEQVQLRCWDFGGQEIYYTTHQFFFSQRAVYVLVWNITLHEEFSRVEYWLESIRYRAAQSYIIIVGTHADGASREDIERVIASMKGKYMPKFSALVDILPVSCSAPLKGIEEFRIMLENVVLNDPTIGQTIPTSFLHLEKCVLNEAAIRDPPIVSFSAIKEIGHLCGLDKSEDLLMAIRSLHDLGTLIHYADDDLLRNVVFLSPSWLTRVMSSIITTRHTYVKNGILEHQHLRQIWREPEFPPSLHQPLLALLEKFDLTACRSSRLTSENFYEGSSLVPSLLPEDPPEKFPTHWPPQLQPSFIQFGRRYKFKFLPRGFFSRLLVRLMHFADPDLIWKNGLVITLLMDGGFSETGAIYVHLHPEQSKLYLQVDVRAMQSEVGTNSRVFSLARLVIDTVDVLIASWFNVPIDVYAPCPVCMAQGNPEPWMFRLQQCEEAVIDSKDSLSCPYDQAVSLTSIVPDVAMATMGSFNVKYEDLIIEKEIGVGGYAVVYKGYHKNQVIAVKTMNFAKASLEEGVQAEALAAFTEFRREIWIMSGLQHPCLVGMIGFCMKPCSIITEFVACGDLFGFIHGREELPFSLVLRIASDIAKGMAFLHQAQPPLLHRDLKSPNVLLASMSPTAPVVAKVADFGLTQAIASDTSGRVVENPVWLAPEVMQRKPYSFESDVYSFGVIAWELVSRTQFFGEISFMSHIEKKVEDGERPPIPPGTDARYHHLIEMSWAGDSGNRPSFPKVCKLLSEIVADRFPELQALVDADGPQVASADTEIDLTSSFQRSSRDIKEQMSQMRKRNTKCLSVRFGSKIPFAADLDLAPQAASSSVAVGPTPELADPKLGAIKTIVTLSRRYINTPKSIIQVGDSSSTITACFLRSDVSQVYVGTSSGLITAFNTDLEAPQRVQGNPSSIFVFNYAMGSLWVGFANSLDIYVPSNMTKPRISIAGIQPTSSCLVSKMMWIGTASKGVAVFDAVKLSDRPKKTIPLDDSVTSILTHGKYIWLAVGTRILKVPKDSYRVSNTLLGHRAPITSLISVGAEVWSSSTDLDIRIWDGERGTSLKVLSVHTASVTSLALVGERIWSGSIDNTIRVWNAHDQSLISEDLLTYDHPISSIVFDPSSQSVFVASGPAIYLWKNLSQ